MSKAWPFEDKVEAPEEIREPETFVQRAGEGTDAMVIRIGLRDAQLVLVDRDGRWQRWVYPSVELAQQAAEGLGIPVHLGEYPEAVRVRMNARRRSPIDFERGAYPEQGDVGPVTSYRENRPRLLGAAATGEEKPTNG
jgi:hypothetical protein